MSFLDRVVAAANEVAGGKGHPDLVSGVVDILHKKGIGCVLSDLKTKGLGEIADSWVGTGEGKLINPEQIKSFLGSEKLQELAQKAGVSQENASKFLGDILPGIIDKLTPQGKPPDDDPAAPAAPPGSPGYPGG